MVGNRDIIVIGASAGGVEALRRLALALPPDLPAAVFVVIHLAPDVESGLAEILDRMGNLPAVWAQDGQPFEGGRIYVAPPDRHLLLERDRMRLSTGPRENRARPAIDPLFRSAAIHFGPRVVGVVLTGMLSDGTAGLHAVKRCGGVAVVQDPADARSPSMPLSALRHVAVDHCVPLSEMGALLPRLAAEPGGDVMEVPDELRFEHEMLLRDGIGIDAMDWIGRRAALVCPECGGALWSVEGGGLRRYRCHVGHAYAAPDLLAAQSETVRYALWNVLRTHEERTELMRQMAADARERGRHHGAAMWEARVRE